MAAASHPSFPGAEPCRHGQAAAAAQGQKISKYGIYPCKLYKNVLESKKYVVQECNSLQRASEEKRWETS